MRLFLSASFCLASLTGSAAGQGGCTTDSRCGNPPSELMGEFTDDYEMGYLITSEIWLHKPGMRYVVTKWDSAGQYLIARNHPENGSEAGKWTRIDWMRLDEMSPWEWAFCISAYDAESATDAEAVTVADRSVPRTGCNGFPFSRMKPATPDEG